MNSTNECVSVAVSTPGGMARQFRVQYQVPGKAEWRLYKVFRQRDLAEQCAESLESGGYRVRVVVYSCCPAGL